MDFAAKKMQENGFDKEIYVLLQPYNHKDMARKFIKTLAVIIISALTSFAASAQEENTVPDLVSFLGTYEEQECVDYMALKGLMLGFAKPALKDTPMKNMIDHIESLCVFNMNNPDKETRKKFHKDISPVLSGYEKILESKEGNTESIIYLKRKDDAVISEMVVYSNDASIAIVIMKGDIPVSDLEEMAAQSN